MSNLPDFILKDIDDKWVRENFVRLQKFMQDYPFFRGEFQFFERKFPAAASNFTFPHGLGFKPTDIIQTSLTGGGVVNWNYSLFTTTDLDVSVTGPCTVRAFVGAYREG